MTNWLENTIREIETKMENEKSNRLIVACSGGVDSMVLLDIAQKLSDKNDWEIAVAHLNHSLRTDAKKDLEIINKFVSQKNIHIFEKTVNIGKIAKENKIGIEEAGRIQRYKYFEKCLKKFSANVLLTAHHHDDQNETILMNLMRGGGVRGLSGIPKSNGQVFRPLLNVKKREIIDYANENEIPFSEDKTNAENQFLRNRVRNQLIPKMEEIFEREIDFNRTAEIFGKTSDFLHHHAEQLLERINDSGEKDKILLCLSDWKLLHSVEQFWVANKIFARFGQNLSENDFNQLQEFIQSKSHKTLQHKNFEIEIYREKIRFQKPMNTVKIYETIKEGQTVNSEWFSFLLENTEKPKEWNDNPNEEYIDLEKMKGESFLLRQWQAGDRIRPFGMEGTKSISDVLTDMKVEPSIRPRILVLADKNDIVWLCGYCLNNNYRINLYTKKIGRLKIRYDDR